MPETNGNVNGNGRVNLTWQNLAIGLLMLFTTVGGFVWRSASGSLDKVSAHLEKIEERQNSQTTEIALLQRDNVNRAQMQEMNASLAALVALMQQQSQESGARPQAKGTTLAGSRFDK
jgi:hypothetical protein